MVAFAGGHTPYAHVVRGTDWGANGIDRAFLLSPAFQGKGGAMAVVPGALGEAFAALWSRILAPDWTSTKGLKMALEVLS
jgi:alpha-beta hydrolase superfamily lysophospholipase